MSAVQQFTPLSPARRRLLKGLLLVGVAGSLGAVSGVLAASGSNDGRYLVLNGRQLATLKAFAEATLEQPGFPPVSETSLLQRIDEELYFVEDALRDDLLLAIDAACYLPLLYGRFSTLPRLSLPKRKAFIESLSATRLETVRAIVNGLGLVTRLVYYADRRVWPVMAYEGTHAGLPPYETEQHRRYRELTGAVK